MLTITIDGFFSDFNVLKRHAHKLSYKGETNPADGVFYPGISTDIPKKYLKQLESRLSKNIRLAFFRLSVFGVKAPHGAHNDSVMAKNTAIIYINSGGGTSLVRHKELGMEDGLFSKAEEEAWVRDTNDYSAWDIVDFCAGVENRAFIIPSYKMHRAEPYCGFGDSPADGRLVMVVFYD